MGLRTIILMAILLLAGQSAVQGADTGQSQYRQLGIQDGLPNQKVHAIDQDRDGFLWIGTNDGLARYDGSSFKVFRHVPGDSTALPGNAVLMVHADAGNRLWVSVEGFGLYRMDAARGGFIPVPLLDGPEPVLDIWAIASDKDGSVWVGTFGSGLFRLLPEGGVEQFKPKAGTTGLPDENVLALAFDAGGTLWIATSSGIVLRHGGKFRAFDNSLLVSSVVVNLLPDLQGGMWLGTQAGLQRFNADGVLETPSWTADLSNPQIMGLLHERDGTPLFVAAKGINRLHAGRITQFFPERTFISAFRDRDGGFWFGSDEGLLRQPEAWRIFKTYTTQAEGAGLRNRRPTNYQMLADGSALVVGESGFLDRFRPDTGEVQPIDFKTQDGMPLRLSAVHRDRQGQIWLGGRSQLLRLDPSGTLLKIWSTGSAADPTLLGPARHILQTSDGLIWIAFYGGGIQARDGQGQVVYNVTLKSGQGLRYPDAESLFIGPDGQLWLTGGEGLLRWRPRLQRFEAVDGAPESRVFSAFRADNGALWLGGLGVLESFQWDAGDERLSRKLGLSGDDGLPAVEINGIGADADGVLWLTTSRGLSRFDPRSGRVRTFGIHDGLVSQEFDLQPPHLGPNGRGFALSKAGLVTFNPVAMAALATPLRLRLEHASVRRQEDEVALAIDKEVVLQHGDRDLSIDALLMDFEDASLHRYRSRLSGFDPDWVEMGSSGRRVFSKLPDGRYRLDIIGAGAEGEWSQPIRLEIRVLPPFWKSTWAIMIYILAALLVLFACIAYFRRRLKRRHEQELERQQREIIKNSSEAKSQFLANLGHEIRTPMTGVLGMTELLMAGDLADKPKSQVLAIQKAGEHLLRLMNDALDLSKIEAGQFELDIQPFVLAAMLDEVAALLSPAAAKKGLAFDVVVDEGLSERYLGDCGRIRQILFNLGSNAVKFTAQGAIAVKVQRLWPKGILLSVSDTGPGMDEAQQARLFKRFVQADGIVTARQFGGSGLGLAISREFALLMGGDIQINSGHGKGSTFSLSLPLDPAPPADSEPGTGGGTEMAAAQSRRILLVEDDETIVSVLRDMLAANGHAVTVAGNALQALAETARSPFDAVICDLDLPGMSGLELVRIWRDQGMHTPVLALTARTQSDAEKLCLQAGMDAFLRKPVTGRQLQQAIEAFTLS